MKKSLAIVLIGVILALPLAAQSATVPVIDLAVLAQMAEEAFWWLEDLAFQAEGVLNQAIQIEQGVLQLEAWALALKNLDFSVLPVVGKPLASIMEVFEASQLAFFNAALIKDRFEELYAPFHFELLPSSTYFTKGYDWNKAVRDSHYVSMQQQAHLPVSLASTTTAMEQALRHSGAAEGHLQAQQAGNQLLGTQIAQHNETNALLGTMAHSQSTRDMQEAAAQDQAMLRLQWVMDGWTTWTREEGLSALPRNFR